MKFIKPSYFADPDAAARKLVQIANAVEAVHDGRIFIELINGPFLKEGGTPDQFRAALARAVTLGWPGVRRAASPGTVGETGARAHALAGRSRHATHRSPSSEMPPPGTIMWTCG